MGPRGSIAICGGSDYLWWQRLSMVAATIYGGSDYLWWQRLSVVAATICGGSEIRAPKMPRPREAILVIHVSYLHAKSAI